MRTTVGLCALLLSLAGITTPFSQASAPVNTLRLEYRLPPAARIPDEVECLAKNIYFEARSEPDRGKIGVALVTLNRVKSPKFPSTVCAVVYQPSNIPRKRNLCQFSWFCDGKSDVIRNKARYNECVKIAKHILSYRRKDITKGATHYHADYVSPWWAKKLKKTVKIGNHIFYRM